jgi:nitrite reductase (cytochrome c-552)
MGRNRRSLLILGVAALVAVAAVGLSHSQRAIGQAPGEVCGSCHPQRAADLAASEHAGLSCLACHPDAKDHPLTGYKMPSASQYFQMEMCGACHADQYSTYTYEDGSSTKYGGSRYKVPKYTVFSKYNTIIDGHGFVREYNEERSHKNMLQDHADIKRGKYEVCLQCKSTRVAYYWNSGRTAVLQNDVTVEWAPTNESFVVPKGTTITLGTDTTGAVTGVKAQVMAEVVWDGVTYTSWVKDGATEDFKRTWVAVYAMAIDGLPAGSPSIKNAATCNHCHDPHTTQLRLVRKELIRNVETKGVNPYAAATTGFEDASKQDKIDTVCGQCHIEYVCGKSGVDGIDRDFIPWAKVRDLEAIYKLNFPIVDSLGIPTYSMDWLHGTGVRASKWPNKAREFSIGVPLIKSQHPETETYWGSIHYSVGRSCADCHMPQVTKTDGTQFTSHWFASPVKYLDPARAQAFAAKFDVSLGSEGVIDRCSSCHGDGAAARTAAVYAVQDAVYAKALNVQNLLARSLQAINRVEGEPWADQTWVKVAVEDHRGAHLRWENLVVSENSMGFHNAEVSRELDTAAAYANAALRAVQRAENAMR